MTITVRYFHHDRESYESVVMYRYNSEDPNDCETDRVQCDEMNEGDEEDDGEFDDNIQDEWDMFENSLEDFEQELCGMEPEDVDVRFAFCALKNYNPETGERNED